MSGTYGTNHPLDIERARLIEIQSTQHLAWFKQGRIASLERRWMNPTGGQPATYKMAIRITMQRVLGHEW